MPSIRAEKIREFYQELLNALQHQKKHQASLKDFSYALKNDPQIQRVKNKIRKELQILYDEMGVCFRMSHASVYLPFRKKIFVRGRAGTNFSLKTEIRVYPVEGPYGIAYQLWTPEDIQFLTVEQLFSTFIHEVAHIHEKSTYGEMGNHGPEFCTSEKTIGEYLRTHGFESLMTYRLSQGPYVPWSRGGEKRRVEEDGEGTFCFVATSVYGNPNAFEVQILRGFRDGVLLKNKIGRMGVFWYYRIGPYIARVCIGYPSIGRFVRGILNVIVRIIVFFRMF